MKYLKFYLLTSLVLVTNPYLIAYEEETTPPKVEETEAPVPSETTPAPDDISPSIEEEDEEECDCHKGTQHFYMTASAASPTEVDKEEAITFDPNHICSSDAYTRFSPEAVMIHEPGNYLVQFTGYSSIRSLLAALQLRLNGEYTGPSPRLTVRGSPLLLQTVITVTEPTLLEVVVTENPLTLTTGCAATLTILKLSH